MIILEERRLQHEIDIQAIALLRCYTTISIDIIFQVFCSYHSSSTKREELQSYEINADFPVVDRKS